MTVTSVIISADASTDLTNLRSTLEEHGLKEVKVLHNLRQMQGLIQKDLIGGLKQIAGVRLVDIEDKVRGY